MSDQPRLYVLDGSYYVYRAYHAIRELRNSKGFPTNGLFAFTQMLLNVVRDLRPEYLAVAFDPPGGSFRDEMYPAYKANREAPPEDLRVQFPWFRRIVQAMRIPVLEVDGFEADDVIGTLVKRGERSGIHVTILSGDKDLCQLVDDDTIMIDTLRGKETRVADVVERFSVQPERVPDVLALAGDTSDNIPGAVGIGEKTAGKLIAEFGSLEALYANLDRVTAVKRRESLEAFAAQAPLSRALTTIRCDVPLVLDLGELSLSAPDFDAFDAICAELDFRRFPSMARELFPEASREVSESRASEYDYRAIFTLSELDEAIAEIRRAGTLSFDLETTSVDPMEAEIVGFALAWKAGHGVYVPVAHVDLMAPRQLDRADVIARLRGLLEDPSLAKVGQNTKYETIVMARQGVRLQGVTCDTMLAAWLIDPNKRRYGLDPLAQEYLSHRNIAYEDVAGSGRTQKRFDEVSVEEATPYAAEDADVTLRLSRVFLPMLEAGDLRGVHDGIELPLVSVLARMEMAGIRVDTALLGELRTEFAGRIRTLEERIWEAAGTSFTIASPKQLGEVLFERLKLRVVKKTKTGPSTDQEVLEALQDEHPLPGLILEYRQLAKLVSTYVETLPTLVKPATGRVHTDYNQAVASTGRLSSSNPNLQNIPVRTHEGRRIRQAFVPQAGWTLLGADYSQIELRVLAHMAEEPVLIEAFRSGEDIHRRTASEIFDVPPVLVSREQRNAAKTINFGVIYGMGASRLARELAIPKADAAAFIERYFERIPGVRRYFDAVVQSARESGHVETITGRRRPIPEILSPSGRDAALGERLAMNAPIQGSAADIIKLAMIRIDADLRTAGMKTRMLLQVHDELVFEVPPEEVAAAEELVRRGMEDVVRLRVPLLVEVATGPNWAALK